MWKVIVAAVLAFIGVMVLSTLVAVSGPWPYLVAGLLAIVWVLRANRPGQVTVLLVGGAAVIGAVAYFGSEQSWAVYLFVIAIAGLAAALTALLFSWRRDPLSAAHDAKQHRY